MKSHEITLSSGALRAITIVLFCAALTVAYDTFRSASAAPNDPAPRDSAVMRGLYLPNKKARTLSAVQILIGEGRPRGINMIVMDVQPYGSMRILFDKQVVDFLRQEKVHTVARLVCFQDGLDRLPLPQHELDRLYDAVEKTAAGGFDELQLDYIRFKDGGYPYPLSVKYRFIEGLLAKCREITGRHGMKLSADLFGRIVYNRDDYVGQKVEVFAKYTDFIYPMLYPSHFSGDSKKISNPGPTMLEGTLRGLNRLHGTEVGLVPYIQAFDYLVRKANMSLDRYVEEQIRAVESTKARGWVAWHAAGNYSSVMKALDAIANNTKITCNPAGASTR
jgi:hypothetical protein